MVTVTPTKMKAIALGILVILLLSTVLTFVKDTAPATEQNANIVSNGSDISIPESTGSMKVAFNPEAADDEMQVSITDGASSVEWSSTSACFIADDMQFKLKQSRFFSSEVLPENVLDISGLFPGIDETYEVGDDLIKHDVVLTREPILPKSTGMDSFDTLSFSWTLSMDDNLALFIEDEPVAPPFESGKPIELRNMDMPSSSFWVLPPFAVEEKDANEMIYLSYIVRTLDDGNFHLSVDIPSGWLQDEERQYPVFLDPTITTEEPLTPLVRWPYNSGSTDTAVDASGNSRDGKINGAYPTTGLLGTDRALDFDGSDSVTYSANGGYGTDEGITLDSWVKGSDEGYVLTHEDTVIGQDMERQWVTPLGSTYASSRSDLVSQINDGDEYSGWYSNNIISDPMPRWVEWDMGKEVVVSGVRVQTASGYDGQFVDIQIWDDSYTTIVSDWKLDNPYTWTEITFPKVTTRWMEFLISADTHYYSNINEVEVLIDFSEPYGEMPSNYRTPTGVATASSEDPANPASYSNDGTTSTRWMSGAGDSKPITLEWDLEADRVVSGFGIRARNSRMRIDVALFDGAWTTVISSWFVGYSSYDRDTFNKMTASRVRVTITSGPNPVYIYDVLVLMEDLYTPASDIYKGGFVGTPTYETPAGSASASTYQYYARPYNSNDGNTGTNWQAQQEDLPQWIQWDLGEIRGVSGIKTYIYSLYAGQKVDVEVSIEGTYFTPVVNGWVLNPGSTWLEQTFPETMARYVRVLVTETVQQYAVLHEVEIKSRTFDENAYMTYSLSTESGGQFIIDNGGVEHTVTNPASVNDGQWHKLTGTYDGTDMVLYVDGQPAGTAPLTASIPDQGLHITAGYDPFATAHYTGVIDDVRVYGTALTPGQVEILAEADTQPPVADPGPDRTAQTNLEVIFNGSASTDNIGISYYEWWIEYDGSWIILEGEISTFTFEIPSVYTVWLKAVDDMDNYNWGSFQLTVVKGPEIYWDLDYPYGTTAYDQSSNERHGRIAGGSRVDGAADTDAALELNGNGGISYLSSEVPDTSEGISLDAWVKTSDEGYVVSQDDRVIGADIEKQWVTPLGNTYASSRSDLVSKINDGDTYSGWYSDSNNGDPMPRWVEWDMGKEVAVSGVRVQTASGYDGQFVDIQIWDGSYTTIVSDWKIDEPYTWTEITFPRVTTRWMEFLISMDTHHYSNINEIEVLIDFTEPYGEMPSNYRTPTGVATASSEDPANPASYSNDGTTSTRWMSRAGDSKPITLEWDLEDDRVVSGFGIRARNSRMRIDVALFDGAWTTVISSWFVGYRSYDRDTFDKMTASRVRVTITSGPNPVYIYDVLVLMEDLYTPASDTYEGVFVGTPAYETPAGSASASTEQYYARAYNSNDGNTGTNWQAQQEDMPQWIQWDLGEIRGVSGIKTYIYSLYAGQEVDVEVSLEGTYFTPVVNGWVLNPGSTWLEQTFPETMARYVRVLVTETIQQYAVMYEVEIKSRAFDENAYMTVSLSTESGGQFIIDDGGVEHAVTYPGSVNDDEWHKLTGTYDGETMILYVDGLSVGTAPLTATIPNHSLRVVAGQDLDGCLDEIRLFGRALTEEEVAELYGTLRGPPPVADAGLNQEVPYGTLVTFDGTGSTDDEGVTDYSWTFTYDTILETLSGPTPAFTFDLPGDYEVTLTVADSNGSTDTDIMWVNVTNEVPTISPMVPAQNAIARTDIVIDLTAYENDAEDSGADLDWTVSGLDDCTVIGEGSDDDILTFTPGNNFAGTDTVTLTLTDIHGAAAVQEVDLVWENRLPTVDNPIPDQWAIVGLSFSYTFPVDTFSDLDDALVYTAAQDDDSALPAWLSFDALLRTFSGSPVLADMGLIQVKVTADDGLPGGMVSDLFLINVTENSPPTVDNSIPDQLTKTGSLYTYQFPLNTFNDAEGDPLTYSAELENGDPLPSWLSFNDGTRTFSGTPTAAETLSIKVIASDNKGPNAEDVFELAVTEPAPPVLDNEIPDQTADVNLLFSYQFPVDTFSDPNGDPLTYSAELINAQPLPAWLSFEPSTRTLFGIPAHSDEGTITIRLNVTDNAEGMATDVFDIVVFNSAPVLDLTIDDQMAQEDMSFSFQFPAGTFSDLNNDVLTYSAELSDGNPLPSWLTFDDGTRTFSGTPLSADIGTISVRVTADDGFGGAADDVFFISVENTLPTLDIPIPDQSAPVNNVLTYQFPANTFTDVGDILTYSAELTGGDSLPGWLSFDDGTRTFSGTPAHADEGTISITVIADDGIGGTVEDTFEVTVANDVPTLDNVILDQTALEDSAFSYQIPSDTFSDNNGDVLTYTATLDTGAALPSWLVFTTATRTFSGTPLSANIGTITVLVSADDGWSGTEDDLFTITVDNNPPVVITAIPDQEATEFVSYSYQFPVGTFDDPGDVLTYSALLDTGSSLPAWLSFNGASQTFSGTPWTPDIGTILVRVTAFDAHGGSVDDVFELTVVKFNDPPVADIGGPYSINEGSLITLDASGSSDPDDYIVSYEWDLDNDGLFDDGTGITTDMTWFDNDAYTVSVKVTDSFGDFSTDTVSVAVLDIAPTASFEWTPEPQIEGIGIQFTDLSTSNPDTITGWAWDFAGLGSSSVQNPAFTFMDDGVYSVTLTVTDDDGSTDGISFDVTLLDGPDPVADFNADAPVGMMNKPVQFTDTTFSYPDDIVSWSWDFAGLGVSSIAAPQFTFTEVGTYTVSLTVTDEDGDSDSTDQMIYVISDSLRINNDFDFSLYAAHFGWIGDGSAGNPYVIDGMDIDGTGLGYGMYIGNTTVHFIMQNSNLHDASGGGVNQGSYDSGLILYNTQNAIIRNNIFTGNDIYGIYVLYSTNIVIEYNNCSGNDNAGIFLAYTDFSKIENNICSDNVNDGIFLSFSDNNILRNNVCERNSRGIFLDHSQDNTLEFNVCNDNVWGIYLSFSTFNTVEFNTCLMCVQPVWEFESNDNVIANNIVV